MASVKSQVAPYGPLHLGDRVSFPWAPRIRKDGWLDFVGERPQGDTSCRDSRRVQVQYLVVGGGWFYWCGEASQLREAKKR